MRIRLQSKVVFIGLFFFGLLQGCSTTRFDWDPDDYTVRSGDTLYSIAWRYELDPFELAEWNHLPSPYIIRPGDRLHTRKSDSRKPVARPAGKPYRPAAPKKDRTVIKVKKGDTLYGLARQYDMPASKLASINGLKQPYVIQPGQELRLRAAAAARTRPAAPATVADEKLDKTIKLRWFWPIKGKLIGHFNPRKNDAKGIDIAGTEGKRVGAAAAGKVVYSGNGLISYGNLVIIKHNRSFLSAYAHNSKLLVEEGQMVKAGQSIAELGKTGTDTPRLHFEIRQNGKPVDPLKYLPRS